RASIGGGLLTPPKRSSMAVRAIGQGRWALCPERTNRTNMRSEKDYLSDPEPELRAADSHRFCPARTTKTAPTLGRYRRRPFQLKIRVRFQNQTSYRKRKHDQHATERRLIAGIAATNAIGAVRVAGTIIMTVVAAPIVVMVHRRCVAVS